MGCGPASGTGAGRRPAFDSLFSAETPVVFAYHGYPALIHQLTYPRTNHRNLHVHGFQEEGTATTPFDMAVLNQIDRFHLARAVVDCVPHLTPARAKLAAWVDAKLAAHDSFIRENGEDMPEIRNWTWRSVHVQN